MASFLEVDPDAKGHILKNLILPDSIGLNGLPTENTNALQTVHPEPGFCVKLKSDDGKKIFINICKSLDLPPPKDIGEDELIAILESDSPSGYKIPLSLGDPHHEKDKSGQDCTAYDVIINQEFFGKIADNILFKTFVITVAIEGLETKHGIELPKQDYTVLKNKHYIGTLQTVQIKKSSSSLVSEFTSNFPKPAGSVKPKFELRWKKFECVLSAKIEIPKVKLASEIMLDMGDDRIVLKTTSEIKYFLDIFIPLEINPDEVHAEFDCKSKILNITATIASK
ncbi:PIH1 domain-containing protein 1 [Chamberlinius hualienensis]